MPIINKMEQEYYEIPNYPRYEISKTGILRNKITKRIIKTYNSNGYEYCRLINEEGYFKTGIHRVIGIVFIPNPNNLPEIDHIDRNRQNNSIENLRWVSRYENSINRGIECKPRKNNSLGEHHITYIPTTKPYRVYHGNKTIGTYETLDEAILERNNYFLNLNK